MKEKNLLSRVPYWGLIYRVHKTCFQRLAKFCWYLRIVRYARWECEVIVFSYSEIITSGRISIEQFFQIAEIISNMPKFQLDNIGTSQYWLKF